MKNNKEKVCNQSTNFKMCVMKKRLFCFFGGTRIFWRVPLSLSLLLLIPATPSIAKEQIKSISVKLENVSLEEAIQQIEKLSGYSFFYDENKIDLTSRVNVNATNKSLYEVLDGVFNATGLGYEISNNQIVLFAQKTTAAFPGIGQRQNVVKGKIVDASGEPVIGANIVEKGTTNGTISDMDGNFTLSVGDKAIIEVSYIGFRNQTVTVPSGGVI